MEPPAREYWQRRDRRWRQRFLLSTIFALPGIIVCASLLIFSRISWVNSSRVHKDNLSGRFPLATAQGSVPSIQPLPKFVLLFCASWVRILLHQTHTEIET